MAPGIPPAAAAASSSSEYTSSSGEEVEQLPPTKSPPVAAPAHQQSDGDTAESSGHQGDTDSSSEVGSSEDLGENGVPIRLPTPEPVTPPEGNLPSPERAKSPPLKRKAAPPDLAELEVPQPKKAAPAVEAARSPPPLEKAAAATTELAKPVLLALKAMGVAMAPNPKGPAGAPKPKGQASTKSPQAPAPTPAPEDDQLQEEQQLEEKRRAYHFLWQEVVVLEAQLREPGMFRSAFLKVADAKATVLNNKIKKQRLAELRLFTKRVDIQKGVAKLMLSLLD